MAKNCIVCKDFRSTKGNIGYCNSKGVARLKGMVFNGGILEVCELYSVYSLAEDMASEETRRKLGIKMAPTSFPGPPPPVPTKYVYLAGPMYGLTHDEASGWRDEATEKLRGVGITCLSPLRGLTKNKVGTTRWGDGIIAHYYYDNPLFCERGILTRDYNDVKRSSLLLVNLLQASGTASIGSISEIGWAYESRKPVVLIMGKDNVHRHPMITEAAGFIVPSLDAAIEVVESVLLP